MNNHDESLTAIDVIRCVYLAREAAKRGDRQSARRWQAKAGAWLGGEKPADPSPTPKALYPRAQGQRSATLGYEDRVEPNTPKGFDK